MIHFSIKFPNGNGGGSGKITELNGLTAPIQFFVTGTDGTDFNIVSAGDTHTWNLPTASAANRGALSSSDWILFNSKGTGVGYSGEVANYSALPDPTLSTGQFWFVLNPQGTAWLPGSLGGTYYPAGTYYSNGTTWITGTSAYQASQGVVDAGIVADQFVSPLTFNNSAQLAGKLSVTLSSTNIFVGNGSNVATGVTFTLSATGGTFSLSNAGVLTMPNANTTTRGLLTSADWNTFNGKGTGSVTSVSVVTANGVSGSVATATTTPAITLTLGNITPISVTLTGTGGAGYMEYIAQVAPPAAPSVAGFRLFSGSTGNLSWMKNDGGTDLFRRTISGTLTASRIYTLQDSAYIIAGIDVAQSWTAAQTFQSSGVKIQNPAATFSYTLVGAAIGANYNLTLPLQTGNDTLAALGVAQSFTAQQTFLAGSSATPGVTFTGSNAGIYSTGANDIRIGTNGSTARLIITNTLMSVSGAIAIGTFTIGTGCNMVFQTSGTSGKIGTGTNQLLSFWNATPIIQPSGANQAAVTDSTGGTASFTLVDVGLAFSQANINNNFASLERQVNEMRNVLVNTGLMKGSA